MRTYALSARRSACTLAPISATAGAALTLDSLSNQNASNGLKAALDAGSTAVIAKLGMENGFLNNDQVKIKLPGILEQARPLLKMTGCGQQLYDLVVSMDRAAESAVPLAKPLLLDAVKSMSVTDARNILAVARPRSRIFSAEEVGTIGLQIPAIVKSVTDRSGVADQYNSTIGQLGKTSLLPKRRISVES